MKEKSLAAPALINARRLITLFYTSQGRLRKVRLIGRKSDGYLKQWVADEAAISQDLGPTDSREIWGVSAAVVGGS